MMVFVDASAWVPMQLVRDQYANRVMELLGGLEGRSVRFVTSNWTLYEALAVARRRSFRTTEQLFLLATETARILPVPGDIEAEALRRFLSWQDKTASVVDHANLLVALEARCDAILSFDDDFAPLARQAGVELLK